MNEHFNTEEEEWDEEERELVARYENTLKNRQSSFFDVDDYEELYFHYMGFYVDFYAVQHDQLKKGGAVLNAALAQYPKSEILQLLQMYHFFRENRLSKKMLMGKLEQIEFPHYDYEHFIHILAHIYRQIGERKRAKELFVFLLEKAEDNEDRTLLYYEILFSHEKEEDVPKILDCCNRILKIGEVSNEVLFWEIYEYFFLKPVAVPIFEAITKQYAFSMPAWLYLGKSYTDMLMYEQAVQAFQYAVALSDNPMPLVALGYTLAEMDKITEAFECFQEAIALDPKLSVLYAEMGEFMHGLEENQHAIHFFNLALEADKNDVSAMLGLAFVYSDLERYEDAIAYIMRAKKTEEELPTEAWLLLADNYIEVNRDEEALEIYQQLVKQYPKDVEIWLAYSNYAAVVEDFQQACDIAREGLAILPDNPYLLYRMANYYFLDRDVLLGATYLYLAFHSNPHLVSFFTDYDEDVTKIPEVISIINNGKSNLELNNKTNE